MKKTNSISVKTSTFCTTYSTAFASCTHNLFQQRYLDEMGGLSLMQSTHLLCNRTYGSHTSECRAGWDDPQTCLHDTACFLSIHECCNWTRFTAYKRCLPQHTAICGKYQNITQGARVSPVVRMLLALQHPQGARAL